jgi:tetratricopeptide (TPR) repeat protein
MPRNPEGLRVATSSRQAAEDRLSPAEVHQVIRQRLEELVVPWGLEAADIARLAQQMQTHLYHPGETILPFHVRADFLGLLVRGQVGAYANHRQSAGHVALLLPGSTFGDPLLGENPYSNTALRALSRCEVRFLRRADLEALGRERQASRRRASRRKVLRRGATLFFVLLLGLLFLSSPVSRQVAALVPMSVGQWCSQRSWDRCAGCAWKLAADLTPGDAQTLLALGNLYFEQGELQAARQAFEQVSALAPDLAEVHNNLGLIYARQGDHPRAIQAFHRALELEPGTAVVEHNLGLSWQASGDPDAALTHYQLALAFGEPQAATLVNMAIAYYETGQAAAAAETARQALAYEEGLAPAHTILGAAALEQGRPEEAFRYLRRALDLEPGYGPASFYLGLAYRAVDQPVEATAALEQALLNTADEVMRARIRPYLRELYDREEVPGP